MARYAGSLLAAALMLAAVACFPRANTSAPAVRIGPNAWQVELATTPEARHRGLSGREAVPEGTGMLFVFPQEEELSFWMLDCKVPIDIAFISADLYVIRTYAMGVEADPAHPVVFYDSGKPAKYALEVTGGALGRLGVKEGDKVELLGPARDAAKDAR